jgi:flagellar hook-length control protein FliK
MNMAISSAPVSTAAASGSTTSAAGPVSGSGFAGVLVQAVGGGSSNANAAAGLPMGSGLIGLLGQLGVQQADDESQDVLAMLTKLMEQLHNLEQADALPLDVQNQLAALLNSFQGLLQQMGQPVVSETKNASQLSAAAASNPVVIALQQTLQQLSKALASNSSSEAADKAFPLIAQLKSVMDSIVQNSADNNTAPVQAAHQKEAAVSAPVKSASGFETGNTATDEASNQTAAAVISETRRPASSLRDPVWRFNVVNGMETTVTDSNAAAVPAVSASESASTGSQPAWTYMQTDSLFSGDSVQSKSGLPAQVPVQQFAQQMEKFLVKQFALTQGNGTTEAKLVLTPEHLGQVDVRIVMQNGHLTAQFMTENVMARDLLDNQMSQLRAALQGQGLQVDRLEVVQQPSSSANMSFLQHDGRQPGSGSNRNGAGGQSKGGTYDDTVIFEAELERTSSLREFGYGSSLNVTA